MALRVKQMSKQEFANVAERQWVPDVLSGEACPQWMRGIPKEMVRLVLASGIFNDPSVIEDRGVTYVVLLEASIFIVMTKMMNPWDIQSIKTIMSLFLISITMMLS